MEQGTLKIKKFLKKNKKAVKITVATLAGTFTLLFLCGVAFVSSVSAGMPDVTKLDEYDPAQTTKIFARDGTLVATLFDQNRTPVKIADVSETMKQAIVSIEDRRFFEHEGVDLKGIARAAVGNTVGGDIQQGASTLTMQLARRLFLDDSRTYTRKLREAILAYKIDHALSKEKILELYLNEVYFGAGAYGIDAAASVYFKVNPKDLNLWQSALLAGLVQAPSAYSPIEDKKAALARMDEVLAAMESEAKITADQRAHANKLASDYQFSNNSIQLSDGMLKFPYFTTYAVKQLSEQFPENYVRRGGLQVYTTMDPKIQAAAEEVLAKEIDGQGRALGADAGAVVVLDNETGQVLAMVGGTEWSTENQFNRAWQARRQPGSSFKMFVYAAALENGFSSEQEFADTEAVFNYDVTPWKPVNSDRKFMGPIPMRTGLQFSRNLVAAKVMAHVGPSRVVTLAHKMGIKAELPQVISLSLGAGEISPLEMARAYSVLPNGGILKTNNVILKVVGSDGAVVEDFSKSASGDRVMSNSTAATMVEMLRRVVAAGTGTGAQVSGVYVAGKTGTTDRFIDAWFVGFNAHHTISVWVGRDDNKPMGRVYGGSIPADIFRQVATAALEGKDKGAELPGIKWGRPATATLCWDSTYVALPTCPKTYQDTFAAAAAPTRECPMHRQTKKQVVFTKSPDGTLTNIGENGELTVAADGLTVTPTPKAEETPEELDPRQDPEVVTSAGAIIPYKEKEPEGGVKVVEVKIEKDYPTTDSTPGEFDLGEPLGEGYRTQEPGVIRVNEDGTTEPVEVPPTAPGDSDTTLGEPAAYPKAGEGGTSQGSTTSTEVIYTNQDLEIPADPVDD